MGFVIFEVETKAGGFLISNQGVKRPIDLPASTLDEVEKLLDRLDQGWTPAQDEGEQDEHSRADSCGEVQQQGSVP